VIGRLGVGVVVGLWLGVADGTYALLAEPELAGPWIDRAGTLAVAMVADAAVVGVLLAAFGAAIRWRPSARERGVLAIGVGAIVAAAGIATVGWRAPADATPGAPPNILLISIDTLRADRLGSYGHRQPTSPNLDALARQGVLFENAYSHSSWTLPSHMSALTGLDPFAHGVVLPDDRLGDEFTTVAESLALAGYSTAAWVGTSEYGYAGSRHGFDQGFATYRHALHPRRFARGFLPQFVSGLTNHLVRRMDEARHQTDSVIGWLRGRRREPFFHFVHYYDVHSKITGLPYEAPEPFREKFCAQPLGDYSGCHDDLCATDRLVAMTDGTEPSASAEEREYIACLYDGGVAYVDHEIGRLLAALESEGLDERTVVIVMSDHGEAFFEHGMPLHVTLHEEILRIPLIVRLPGGAAGKRARGIARLIDLTPTILDVAGVDTSTPFQGQSLARVLREWPANAGGAVLAADHRSGAVSLRQGSAKRIENGTRRKLLPLPAVEYYDLEDDPAEQRRRPAGGDADPLRAELAALQRTSTALHRAIATEPAETPAPLNAAERDRLRALGYVE